MTDTVAVAGRRHAGSPAVLSCWDVSKSYGGVHAVRDVSLEVHAGEVLGLIGPNGAGKTTLLNLLSGFAKPDNGRVELLGEDVTGRRATWLARRGLTRTFQTPRVFDRLTVEENLRLARFGQRRRRGAGFLTIPSALPSTMLASKLPMAARRQLEIERAAVGHPSAVLLDEPSSGLTPIERDGLGETIGMLAAEGIGVVLVSHDVGFVLGRCDFINVLAVGEVIASGTPDEVRRDEAVIRAYLGEEWRGTEGEHDD